MKKPKAKPKPETECFYCRGNDHWKQNWPKYLADKKDGKVNKGIFDTGSVAHVCNSNQELQIKQRLAKNEVTICAGNGSKVDVIAIGTLPLHLPSGLVLDLNNFYWVPALSMNIICGSCLLRDGYLFQSENNA